MKITIEFVMGSVTKNFTPSQLAEVMANAMAKTLCGDVVHTEVKITNSHAYAEHIIEQS